MDLRLGLLLLCILGASWSCNARQFYKDASDLKMYHQEQETKDQALEKVGSSQVCTLCEEFTAQALGYIANNETQSEIIDTLHTSCSRLRTFKEQCVTLVDYYAPLFFLEASSVQPGDFCEKVDLCEQITTTSTPRYEDSCGFCHQAVAEALIKLKDPDTQMDILEVLLKVCASADTYEKQCKSMVFQYAPLIIANSEKYLETTDVCSVLAGCTTSKLKKLNAHFTAVSDSLSIS